MISFYGGPAGQSFNIKKVFSTYAELLNDINKGWKSEISVGEFVMISYGEPASTNYETNSNVDLKAGYGNKNSTLWQKIYNEGNTSTGIQYKFISSCTGFTPRMTVGDVLTLAPGTKATVEIDKQAEGYPDEVKIDFGIPGGWNFDQGDQIVEEVSVDDTPRVILENIGNQGTGEVEDQAYYGRFTFVVRKSQKLAGTAVDELEAQEVPYAYLTDQGSHIITKSDGSTEEVEATVDEPVLHIGLPQAQTIGSVDNNALLASQEPKVTLITESTESYPDASITNPVLVFDLPIAWNIKVSEVINLVNPLETAKVETSEDNNASTKTLTFTMPRAAQFHYADSKDDFSIQGDYYIIKSTGSLWGYNKDSADWEEIVCFVPPIDDEVQVDSLTPYSNDGSGTQTSPSVDVEYNSSNKWQFRFGLPTAPTIAVDYEFIGASDIGSVERSYTSDGQGVKISFKIPQGSELLSGEGAPSLSTKNGDFYLDAKSGDVYKLIDSTWQKQSGNLRGPVGNPLEIQDTSALTVYTDISSAKSALAMLYPEATPDQIYPVTIQESEEAEELYYWFYKAGEDWIASRLTGGTSGLIKIEYDSTNSEDKAYSVSYINSLIDDSEELPEGTEIRKTYSRSKIDELLGALDETLNTWGRFTDLPDLPKTT